MLNQLVSSETIEIDDPSGEFDSDEDVDFEHSQSIDDLLTKRRKLNEDERVQRCRERNRIHARNTRERKRAQMDLLQQKIQELSDEKKTLENYEPEESVASILMSLSGSPKRREKNLSTSLLTKSVTASGDDSSKRFAAEAIERIKSEISATLSDDEELEMNSEILMKDKSACSGADLEMIRRERNRMHAKKTRLRKKKMLSEMESIIHGLERDIRDLRQRHNLGPDEYTSSMNFRRQPASSLTISGAVGGSKFTGFRHVHRSDGAVKSLSEASLGCLTNHDPPAGHGPQTGTLGIAMSKATASVKENEMSRDINPLFPTLYPQDFTASASRLFLSTQSESATTTPAQSAGSRSSSSSSGEYNQFVHPKESHITQNASTGSLPGIQGPMDRLGVAKRSNSELSSGTTSCSSSLDDFDGGGEQRCAGILYLAATAAAATKR